MRFAHRVEPDSHFRLSDIDTNDHGPFSGKDDPEVARQLADDLARLGGLQERLYAEQRQALLVVLQAMDTGGKDGVLRRVVGPLDSRGVHVASFKAPSSDELAHDYLWRAHARAPRRGDIVFFNRSQYEDVLVVRVLDLVEKARLKRRYAHLVDFERMLADEGTRVIKIFLHISREEQKKRLQERLDDPTKRWKFELADLEMRQHWGAFQEAYEEALRKTSTTTAPWYVVPADRKWYRDVCVARLLVETLEDMNPQFPPGKLGDPSRIVIPD